MRTSENIFFETVWKVRMGGKPVTLPGEENGSEGLAQDASRYRSPSVEDASTTFRTVSRELRRTPALSRAMQIDPVQIAAFGTLISLTTLILTLYFRWRDSRTRLEITYVLAEHLGDVPPAWQKETTSYAPLGVHGPSIVFRVLNKSSFAVTVSAAYLDLGGGEVVQREEGALPPDRQLAPGRPFIGAVRMDAVIGRLVDLGYSGTPEIQLVVEDSLGKRYTKQVKIPNIEDSEYARNRKPDDGAGGETDAG